MSETFASDLLKDFWSGGDSPPSSPRRAETWTLEAGKTSSPSPSEATRCPNPSARPRSPSKTVAVVIKEGRR